MERIRSSPAVKLIVGAVMLMLAFAGSWCGACTLDVLPFLNAQNWQESSVYYTLLSEREAWLAGGIANAIQAELSGDELTYLAVQSLEERAERLRQAMSRENTWFRYQVKTADGSHILDTNLEEGETLLDVVSSVDYAALVVGENMTQEEYDAYHAENDYVFEIGGPGRGDLGASLDRGEHTGELPVQLVIECGVSLGVDDSCKDEFYQLSVEHTRAVSQFQPLCIATVILLSACLVCMLFLLWAAGHRPGAEGVVLGGQDRIFLEIYGAGLAAVWVALILFGAELCGQLYGAVYRLYLYTQEERWMLWLIHLGLSAVVTAGVGTVFLALRTLTVRAKARCLGRTTLVIRVGRWTGGVVRQLVRALPLTWKILLAFCLYAAFSAACCGWWGVDNGFWTAIWLAVDVVAVVLLSWWATGYHRLRQGIRVIAAGDLDHQIDTGRMPYDLRLQAEDLNNISVGLAGALDEKMKSERFKAELITNVSHDLKTPLTSIINYVDLLKTTQQPDPKAVEYIEVLDRKSQRLKKLTEDLVEASKASTGVLTVEREKIGMAQLIDQAMGEWEEKLSAQDLTLVLTLPEGETWVYADGRHLWRVLDNLLSNCAKYAMEGTRVYLELVRGRGQVVLTVKNISREPLNIPAERLVERFVRGEESRTTEGSGLGLSIARSLTELQGGQFQVAVDGDLFKAVVTLPQAN